MGSGRRTSICCFPAASAWKPVRLSTIFISIQALEAGDAFGWSSFPISTTPCQVACGLWICFECSQLSAACHKNPELLRNFTFACWTWLPAVQLSRDVVQRLHFVAFYFGVHTVWNFRFQKIIAPQVHSTSLVAFHSQKNRRSVRC